MVPHDLAEAIALQSEGLQAGALSAGLMRCRVRSTPERLVGEARRFISLLARAVSGAPRAELRQALVREVRAGAFACASEREVNLVFAVWRRAVQALFAGALDRERLRLVLRTMAGLEEKVCAEARAWEEQRIDLLVLAASAGGLPALEQLISPLDPELPATVVAVLHVSPHAPSLLATILARKARMPVTAAVDGGALHLGTAYIAPPGYHLSVSRRHTRLLPSPAELGVKPAANVLFCSAAHAFQGRVASVVLTGTGTDGALGSRAVLQSGGATFAQDPATSQFSGMPAAAIAAGAIEHVLPLPRLPEALQRAVALGRRALVHA